VNIRIVNRNIITYYTQKNELNILKLYIHIYKFCKIITNFNQSTFIKYDYSVLIYIYMGEKISRCALVITHS